MTNLPNPLPAGTVVSVFQTRDKSQSVEAYTLTAPVHLLDDGMVEAVKSTLQAFKCDVVDWSDEAAHLRAAFAHVILPPQETVKEKALGQRMRQYREGDITNPESIESLMIAMADAIDALRAELKEARNGR